MTGINVPIKRKPTSISDQSKKYQAWPIFVISFLRLFALSIFERAFLNYIYFYKNISESELGYISSATALAYILGPLIGHVITKKIGIRSSIVLSCITTPIITGLQMIYFDPVYLISIRIISGILLGVYWPNCYNLLSRWQAVSSEEKSTRNFKRFNYSWNIGFISGLLVGYFWAFYLNEYFTMSISWILSFLMMPFSFFIKNNLDPQLNSPDNLEREPHSTLRLASENSTVKIQENVNHKMTLYPILFSWVALSSYTIAKSIFRFSYPIFLKNFGAASYYAYLIQLAIQIGQLIGLTWTNSMKVYTRKISVFVSFLAIVLTSLFVLIFQDLLFISIITATVGLYIGLLLGASLKIMIDYGAAKNSNKYSTINEVLKGLGFGLTPIAAGYVAEINIYALFVFLIIFGVVNLFFLIYLSRDIKSKTEKSGVELTLPFPE